MDSPGWRQSQGQHQVGVRERGESTETKEIAKGPEDSRRAGLLSAPQHLWLRPGPALALALALAPAPPSVSVAASTNKEPPPQTCLCTTGVTSMTVALQNAAQLPRQKAAPSTRRGRLRGANHLISLAESMNLADKILTIPMSKSLEILKLQFVTRSCLLLFAITSEILTFQKVSTKS